MILDIHVHPPPATLPREKRLDTFKRMLAAGRRAGIDQQVLVGHREPGSDEWARELVERIGSDRIFFGTRTPILYAKAARWAVEQSLIDDQDKARILGENTARLLGVDS